MTRTGLFLGIALVAACGGGDDDRRQILVGAVIDRTGTNSSPSWSDAIELAFRHANDGIDRTDYKGGGFRLGVDIEDDAEDPKLAVTRATTLVHERGAVALIGGTSQNARALAQTFYDADPGNDLGVPVVCGSCTASSINNPNAAGDTVAAIADRDADRWIYRTNMSSALIALVIMRTIMNKSSGGDGDINGDGIFKLSMYANDDSSGTSASKSVVGFATALSPSISIEQVFFPGEADPDIYDFGADLERLTDDKTETPSPAGCRQGTADCTIDVVQDAAPDAVSMHGFALHYAGMWRHYTALGQPRPPVVFFHTARISSVLSALGSAAEGIEGVSHVLVDDSESGRVFSETYTATTGNPIQYRDAIFYDAAAVLVLAAFIAMKDLPDPTAVTGTQLRDAMPLVTAPDGEPISCGPAGFARAIELIRGGQAINYQGASGPLDFDPHGNVRNNLAHFVVQDGLYVDTEKYDCVASDDCLPLP
jgi:ABC-type branched-subunit amino acid transport system substrate-binding protein